MFSGGQKSFIAQGVVRGLMMDKSFTKDLGEFYKDKKEINQAFVEQAMSFSKWTIFELAKGFYQKKIYVGCDLIDIPVEDIIEFRKKIKNMSSRAVYELMDCIQEKYKCDRIEAWKLAFEIRDDVIVGVF